MQNPALQSLFEFYLEDRGWLFFLTITSIIFIVVLVDNYRNQRGAITWLIGLFLCLLAFAPAALYDIGPEETVESLKDSRLVIFTIGVLGLILPIMLAIGYWITQRTPAGETSGHEQPAGAMPPAFEQAAPAGGQGLHQRATQPPEFATGGGFFGPGDDEKPTIMDPAQQPPPFGASPDYPPPVAGAPAAPQPRFDGNGEKPTQLPHKAEPNYVNAWLIDVTNPSQRYQLRKGDNIIGRGPGHQISLMDNTVSRRGHAAVRENNGVFTVRDLGSSYGTRLNGYVLEKEEMINPDSVLTVGDIQLKFVSSS